jgi:PST family polysaccharide transporter
MDFRSLALLANGAVIAAGLLGLLLARRGFGIWALVAYQLAVPAATLVLYWTFTRWRPGRRMSLQAARDLARFSAGSLLAGLGSFVNTRADALIMGLLFGPAAVGAYRLAERLVALVIESAARPVQAVALPDFARVQDQKDELTSSTLRCIRVSALLTAAPLAVLAAGAAEVTVLVGPKWADAAGALRWLCLAGLGRSLVLFLGPLLVGVGRPQALAALLWGTALPSAAAVLVAASLVRDAPLGTQAAAIGASRAALFVLVVLPIAVFAARRLVSLPAQKLVASIGPSLGAGGVGAAALMLARQFMPDWEPSSRFAAATALAAASSAGGIALLLLDRSLRNEVIRFLFRRYADAPPRG